jgi:hypothetical protein
MVLAVVASLAVHASLVLSPLGWHARGFQEQAFPILEVQLERDSPTASADTTLPEGAPLPDTRETAPEEMTPGPLSRDAPVESVEDRLPLGGAHSETEGVNVSSSLEGPLDFAAGGETAVDADAPAPLAIEPGIQPTQATEAIVATVAAVDQPALTQRVIKLTHKLLDSGSLQQHFTFRDHGREFSAVVRRKPAAGSMDIERLTAEITTVQAGKRVSTSVQLKRLAFSHFTQLIDYWQPWVQLHDDEIAGRFHSNSDIYLTYDRQTAPHLLGKVTTTRGVHIDDEKGWRPRGEIFAGGLQTRAEHIGLPRVYLPVAGGPDVDVHVLASDATVVFDADGSYESSELESQGHEHSQLATDRPTYIVGLPGADLRVRGIVNGKVTLYAHDRIVVQGNITYARDPHTGAIADAYLGLVSDGSVEIDRAEITGPGNLEIDAAIYARKRFAIRGTAAREGGILLIRGSLTAGSTSETEPRYATRIEFDPRFEFSRPPGFPQTDQLEADAWDGQWRPVVTVDDNGSTAVEAMQVQ